MFPEPADCRNWKNSIGMNQVIVQSRAGVTLAGGAVFGAKALMRALNFAPRLVAADGGADRLLALGAAPEAVIGDLDSISARAKAAFAGRIYRVPEQDSTDFDKARRAIAAPFVLGLGFTGGRLDHGLAVLAGLVRQPAPPCLLVSAREVTFAAPAEIALDLPIGSRLSLFPMAPVQGISEGLRWPIDGLAFSPGGVIGTSNAVVGPVRLSFAVPGMLVIVPVSALAAVLRGLRVG